MVLSGLTQDVTVSHYRLPIHLTTAILIISMLFWLIRNISSQRYRAFFVFSKKNLLFQILIFFIFIQIIIGAFVSGLDAGKIYQTWPLMGNNYIPDDLSFKKLVNIFDLENHSLVQFYHRNFAYFIILYVIFISIYIFKNKISFLYKPLKILLFFLFLQVILGIYTLISGLNIYLASLHQITSVLLIFSALNLYFLRVN
jgi:cytochrome c oxidase assembly protein subunit 15